MLALSASTPSKLVRPATRNREGGNQCTFILYATDSWPAITALGVAVALAVCSGSAIGAVTASTPSLAGTWSGHYSGAYSGTFKLQWKESRSHLNGSITLSNPAGKYNITGSVHGKAITFGTVGVGTTYTGSVSGKSMSGTYKTGPSHGTWSARKTS